MSDRTTLLALAERCEQTAGPDRLLDAEIALTQDYTFAQRYPERRQWWRRPDGRRVAHDPRKDYPPNYTSSLDAALTLVPEGRAWTVGQNLHHWHWQASINALNDAGNPTSIGFGGPCGWPALALCAAALRARAVLGEKR
jgi:hypothetical protein